MAKYKKNRQIKKTVLSVGEGETEQAFLKFIKQIYVLRKGGVSVNVKLGKQGGDLSGELSKVCRIRENGDYECVFLLRDLDTKEFKSGEKINDILILGSYPCIEGLFLDILEPNKRKSSWNSSKCKQTFEKLYIDEKKKLDSRNYCAIFPKQILDEARKRISVLNEILNIFEGKF